MAAAMFPPPPVSAGGEAVETGVPTLPRHAPSARRAAVPDSAQRALHSMSRPAGYLAGGLATPIWTILGGTAPLP